METVPHVVLEYDKWSDCAIDPPETASAATRATFGGTAAWPVYRGHKN